MGFKGMLLRNTTFFKAQIKKTTKGMPKKYQKDNK
jgi:hypothetical protein